jgi:hypothetical protein
MPTFESQRELAAGDAAMTFAESFQIVNAAIAMLMDNLGLKPGAAWAMIEAASRDAHRTAAQVSADYIADGHFRAARAG